MTTHWCTDYPDPCPHGRLQEQRVQVNMNFVRRALDAKLTDDEQVSLAACVGEMGTERDRLCEECSTIITKLLHDDFFTSPRATVDGRRIVDGRRVVDGREIVDGRKKP